MSNDILNQFNNIQYMPNNNNIHNNNIQNNQLQNNNIQYMNQLPNVQLPNVQLPNNQSNEVNGGVSLTLDYDIKLMSDFILKSSLIAFNINSLHFNNNFNSILTQINSVLNATRLPKVTIFQSLDYLFKYLDKTQCNSNHISLELVYNHIIISFILANKFNDDKTFTNKSWSQATSIPLTSLNNCERNWLQTLHYNLFTDKFIAYDDFVFSYEIFIQEHLLSSSSSSSSANTIIPSSSTSPISSIQSPIIKDTDFTNRQGGFNYDYYIFGQNNNNNNNSDILLTPMPVTVQQQQFAPLQLPLPLPLPQYTYDQNFAYYPQTNRWNNSDLMNFHVSSINNINYNTVY
ncbi:PHO85 cyclin Clg1p [Monosporozyma servazzii]